MTTRFIQLAVIALVGLGCGDSEGTGGSATGGAATGGSGTGGSGTGGAATGGAATGGAATGGSGTGGAATGGAATGGSGTGGGALGAFGDPCVANADCASNVCHEFPAQGGSFCTLACATNADCAPPSSGCNNMGFCKLN